MNRWRRPTSQRWKTFLRNHADGVAAMDLFVVPTISFKLLYGLAVMSHDGRRILHLSTTEHPATEWIAQRLTEAADWELGPQYIIRDRDFSHSESPGRRREFQSGACSSAATSLLVTEIHCRPQSWQFRRMTAWAVVPEPATKSRMMALGLLMNLLAHTGFDIGDADQRPSDARHQHDGFRLAHFIVFFQDDECIGCHE